MSVLPESYPKVLVYVPVAFMFALGIFFLLKTIAPGAFLNGDPEAERSITLAEVLPVAIETRNKSLCESINTAHSTATEQFNVDETIKVCLSEYSVFTRDIATCEALDSKAFDRFSYHCASSLARALERPDLCRMNADVTSEDDQYQIRLCEQTVYYNPVDCEQFISKDRCYNATAENSLDISTCEKIESADLKARCRSSISSAPLIREVLGHQHSRLYTLGMLQSIFD